MARESRDIARHGNRKILSWMTGLTLTSEGCSSPAKLQPLHEFLHLRSGCTWGYNCRILENKRWEVVEISTLCKVYLVSVSHYWDTLSDTVCQFVSEVEDYSLSGYCNCLMKEGTVGEWGYCGVASFPGPVPRAGGRAWFQPFTHVLNCRGIPRWPHTIDILLYSCDANTDTTHYTVHRFTIPAYVVERNSLYYTYPAVDLKLWSETANSYEVGSWEETIFRQNHRKR